MLQVRNMCKNLDELLENLPASLQEFYCWGNQITKIENLPMSLQRFRCGGNQITHVDYLELRRFNGGTFDLEMYNSIKRIQRRIRCRSIRRNNAAHIIQAGCRNWIWKSVTKDGKLGIDLRRGMKDSGLGDFMYPIEM